MYTHIKCVNDIQYHTLDPLLPLLVLIHIHQLIAKHKQIFTLQADNTRNTHELHTLPHVQAAHNTSTSLLTGSKSLREGAAILGLSE